MLSAAMAARANAALGGTTIAGESIHQSARLLIEAGNALAPNILLGGDASSSSSSTTTPKLLQPLDVREFLSPLSLFGYSFVRELLEQPNQSDEALRTVQVDRDAQLVHCTLSPRSHDDLMLRTPQRGEPVCARGDHCEASKLRFRNAPHAVGKPAMAYWPPHLWEVYSTQAAPNSEQCFNQNNRLCLLCLRLLVTEVHTMMMAAGTSQRYHDVALVPFYNAVDVPGEYRLVDTIGSGRFYNGLVGNVVAHDRCAYALEQRSDTLYVYHQLYPKPGSDDGGGGDQNDSLLTPSPSLNALLRRAEREGFRLASPVVGVATTTTTGAEEMETSL